MDLLPTLTSFVIGVGLHLALFRHGEWHLLAFTFKFIHIIVIQLLIVLGVHLADPRNGWLQSASAASYLVAGLTSGVFSSMIVYRAFFHRLTRHGFAGPFVARLSQFYMTALASKKIRLCDDVEILHRKYGDFVRVGPTEVSIADPKAMVAIHGTNTKPGVCTKGPWYDLTYPKCTLQGTRDRQLYSQRRKPWDQAFSSKGQYFNYFAQRLLFGT